VAWSLVGVPSVWQKVSEVRRPQVGQTFAGPLPPGLVGLEEGFHPAVEGVAVGVVGTMTAVGFGAGVEYGCPKFGLTLPS